MWKTEDMGDLSGRRFVVTGVSGLASAIIETLAAHGAEVIVAGRSPIRAGALIHDIETRLPDARLSHRILDLGDLGSVQTFVEAANRDLDHIDVLINNAAVMAELKRGETKDGFEKMFGTNHLGHFALTLGLLPLLRKGTNPRVVSLASGAHKIGEFDFGDLQSTNKFKPMVAYGKTKLATLMFAKELQRRSDVNGWGITSVAAHPGFARTQGVYDRLDTIPVLGWIAGKTVVPLLSHVPEKAAESTLFAATSPDATGGGYYGPQSWRGLKGPVGPSEPANYAEREDIATRLWDESEKLTGVSV
ncbi:MAG TPA: short chain dehydrogenase [Maritimibacter sp.]|nr:short chain dehydrogenase [Maritimibacter sp.]